MSSKLSQRYPFVVPYLRKIWINIQRLFIAFNCILIIATFSKFYALVKPGGSISCILLFFPSFFPSWQLIQPSQTLLLLRAEFLTLIINFHFFWCQDARKPFKLETYLWFRSRFRLSHNIFFLHLHLERF